jgi:hypothetical protein
MKVLMRNKIVVTLGFAAVLATLGGCAVYPADPYYGNYYGNGGVVAPVEPPAPYAETYGVAPFPGALWIGGYWGWEGGRHVWTPGRWEHPRPGYHWVPRTWTRQGNGWHQHGGHWEHH